jgi:hypothetical protein
MATKVSTILLNAATALTDERNHRRWPLSELMRYLNDGLLELLEARPQAFSETRSHNLTAGSRQTVSGVYAVLDVPMNVDPLDTTVPKRTIRRVTKRHLDNFDRDWHSATPATLVNNVVLDEFQKHRFWVHPPSDGTGAVEIEVAVSPDTIAVASGDDPEVLASYDIDLPVDAVYAPALTYYVLHRAWAKDADFAANQQNSNQYYELFKQAVGAES